MEGKDTMKDGQGHMEPEDQGDPYPADMDDEAVDGPETPEHVVPAVRGPAVRQKVLQARPPMTRKEAKRVKKRTTRIMAREKQRKALELRKAGATYDDIAKAVGYADSSGARKAVIKAFNNVIQEPVAEVRILRGEQLNHMLMTLWPKVQQGDENAIRTALAVMDKHDRLTGADQPAQTVTNNNTGILVIDGNKDDYISAARKMAGLGIQEDGTNAGAQVHMPALPVQAGTRYPPGMGPQVSQQPDVVDGDVVDAEVVEEGLDPYGLGSAVPEPTGTVKSGARMSDCTSPLGEVCKDPKCPLHFPHNNGGGMERIDEPTPQPKKKFSFGVEPTVRKK